MRKHKSMPRPLTVPFSTARQVAFFSLVLLSTLAGIVMMTDILRANGMTWVEWAILVLFTVTFGWIAVSFWTAMAGFSLWLVGRHPITLRRAERLPVPAAADHADTRTAVVMPVYNEQPEQALARLAATWRSLESTGSLDRFDFFVLSDTTDTAIAGQEQRLWAALVRELDAEGKLFYRRRAENAGRKAGNIAEFCRRWGNHYDYMLVLDADSVVTGETVRALVATMDANPQAGIVQTAPVPVGQKSPFARMQQFAAALIGPMLSSGASFWQVGESNYWGHNAIIRVAAFTEHCGLPALAGKPPLGGEILSHDFVEAALIRRAGWKVYLLPELDGSFEEVPSNMLDFAKRDRRWAQGNLQHLQLVGMRRLHPLSRIHLLLGALAYASSLMWVGLLLLSTGDALGRALVPHDYFGAAPQLFPDWPVSKTDLIFSLLTVTAIMLFLPKILAVFVGLTDPVRRRQFGGGVRMSLSAFTEILFSVLNAPVMMAFHAWFVIQILAGRSTGWNSQTRTGRRVSWGEATRRAALPTLVGLVWGTVTWMMTPVFFLWVTPVVIGLVLAIPLIVLSSWEPLGTMLRRAGLFLSPSETTPHAALRDVGPLSQALDSLKDGAPAPLPRAVPGENPAEMPAQPLDSWTAHPIRLLTGRFRAGDGESEKLQHGT
ncbi:MAG: glucans biosynthesis glucosyltransferase MdoH [Acetobacterales bacterium]